MVCEWDADPNNLRLFESTNGVNGHAWNGSPTDVENRVRCVQPRTAAGICEDHLALVGGGAQSWNVSAVSVLDIGLCSSSMPANEFAAILTEEWRKGTEDRLGGQTPPNAGDVFLWSDVTIDLKTGDFPPEMFFDWTVPIFPPGQRITLSSDLTVGLKSAISHRMVRRWRFPTLVTSQNRSTSRQRAGSEWFDEPPASRWTYGWNFQKFG